MKIKVLKPFIGRVVHPDGRVQWAVYWRGEEYGKYNSYTHAELERDNLAAVDKNQERHNIGG